MNLVVHLKIKTDYKVKYRKKVMLSNEYLSTLDPIYTYKVKIKTIPDWTSNIEIEKKVCKFDNENYENIQN